MNTKTGFTALIYAPAILGSSNTKVHFLERKYPLAMQEAMLCDTFVTVVVGQFILAISFLYIRAAVGNRCTKEITATMEK